MMTKWKYFFYYDLFQFLLLVLIGEYGLENDIDRETIRGKFALKSPQNHPSRPSNICITVYPIIYLIVYLIINLPSH